MGEVSKSTAALLGAPGVLSARTADVGRTREQRRRRTLWRLALSLGVVAGWMWYRILDERPFNVFALPKMDAITFLSLALALALPAAIIAPMVIGGRSPHVLYRPDQIAIALDDVRGIDPIKEEVVRSLNLFLAHKTFANEMGGTPRRGLLFEGSPGTGKTYLAKAMAAEAGVPFLFVSATSFQSMFYGATMSQLIVGNWKRLTGRSSRIRHHSQAAGMPTHRARVQSRRRRRTSRWAPTSTVWTLSTPPAAARSTSPAWLCMSHPSGWSHPPRATKFFSVWAQVQVPCCRYRL